MIDSWKEADSDYFENLFNRFDKHSDWEYDNRIDRENAAEIAAEQIEEVGRKEYSFTHTDTEATLHVGIPDLKKAEPYAVSGTLLQGITHPNYKDGDELVSELVETQEAISDSGSQDVLYVEPNTVDDAIALAAIQVPFDYDGEEFQDALDSLSNVSKDVEEMHSSLFEELERYR